MDYIFASLLPTVGLLAAYYAFHVIQLYLARSKLIREHGCQPTAYMPQKDPILGLDLFVRMARLAKERRLVEDLKQRYDTYSNTYSSTTLGTTAINTIEPQNIQTVWASNFKDYGIEPFRLAPMEPFTGRGIFNSDGAYWERSRALIRPTFNKANLANLAGFELHLKKLIDIIPRDGSTVDLQALLHKLVSVVPDALLR
jgi:cytochrome P450